MDSQISLQERLKFSAGNEENKPKTFSILDLPIVNLYKILSYIDAKTLLTKVQLSCKLFRAIIEDDYFWKAFHYLLFNSDERLSEIVAIVKRCTNLQYLEIALDVFEPPRSVSPCLLDALSDHIQFRSLTLRHHKFDLDCRASFQHFMESLPNLTSLCLKGCYVDDPVIEVISKGRLKRLHLSPCCFIQDESFIKLFSNCQQLEHLYLSNFQGTLLGDRAFDTLFTYAKNLRTLTLIDSELDARNVAFIKNCSKLSELCICCEYLDDSALNEIKELTHLTKLQLVDCYTFTNEGIRNFLEKGSFSQLINLSITYCSVLQNSTLEIIAGRCQQLKCLDISGCDGITDEGINYLINKCYVTHEITMAELDEYELYLYNNDPEYSSIYNDDPEYE